MLAACAVQAVIDAHTGKSETLEQDINTAARHLRLQVHARGSTIHVCAAALRMAMSATACRVPTEQPGPLSVRNRPVQRCTPSSGNTRTA